MHGTTFALLGMAMQHHAQLATIKRTSCYNLPAHLAHPSRRLLQIKKAGVQALGFVSRLDETNCGTAQGVTPALATPAQTSSGQLEAPHQVVQDGFPCGAGRLGNGSSACEEWVGRDLTDQELHPTLPRRGWARQPLDRQPLDHPGRVVAQCAPRPGPAPRAAGPPAGAQPTPGAHRRGRGPERPPPSRARWPPGPPGSTWPPRAAAAPGGSSPPPRDGSQTHAYALQPPRAGLVGAQEGPVGTGILDLTQVPGAAPIVGVHEARQVPAAGCQTLSQAQPCSWAYRRHSKHYTYR
jgi:hypothetical protein